MWFTAMLSRHRPRPTLTLFLATFILSAFIILLSNFNSLHWQTVPLSFSSPHGILKASYSSTTTRTRPLSISSNIIIISLARRKDRRVKMEALRCALELKWEYADALEKNDEMVTFILGMVRKERERMKRDAFRWPDEDALRDLETVLRAYNRIWTLEDDDMDTLVDTDRTSVSDTAYVDARISGHTRADPPHNSSELDGYQEPLLCSIEDNTIPVYVPPSHPPPHLVLSRGMIACWYSHLTVIADFAFSSSSSGASSVPVSTSESVSAVSLSHESLVAKFWSKIPWLGSGEERKGVIAPEDVMIVFEDDVDVEWDLRESLDAIWEDLPREWDLVMLGHCWSNESIHPALPHLHPHFPFSPFKTKGRQNRLHPSYAPKCTHAYAISRIGARRLLGLLTYPPFAFSRALDQAIAHLVSRGLLRSFSVVPSLVVQRHSMGINDGEEGNAGGKSSGMDPGVVSDIWEGSDKRGSTWRETLRDSTFRRLDRFGYPQHDSQ